MEMVPSHHCVVKGIGLGTRGGFTEEGEGSQRRGGARWSHMVSLRKMLAADKAPWTMPCGGDGWFVSLSAHGMCAFGAVRHLLDCAATLSLAAAGRSRSVASGRCSGEGTPHWWRSYCRLHRTVPCRGLQPPARAGCCTALTAWSAHSCQTPATRA